MSKIKKVVNYILHVRDKGRIINISGLYIAFALISLYAVIMGIVCFIKSDVIMGITNIVIALVMTLTILIFSKIKSHTLLSVFVVIFIYTLMVYFLYEGGVGGVSIMWLLFVPVAGMALINLYYGSILSLLLGITVPLYMFTPLHYLGYQYSEEYRIRFPIIYWAFFILALVIFIRIERSEEAQKEMVKKADEANRSKSEFLANMSHELRTPMNAIMGMCELTLNEEIPENVRENNENIHQASKNLMSIINDLLDFSKIESGNMELSCSQYRLSEVLNDVLYMTSARKGGKKIEYLVDCDPDIPDVLYGDELRIKQIMINLITNAIKYTEEGGFLLSVSHRREKYGINLIISVKDSGIGIQKSQLGKIFNAYGRIESEKVHAIEGTGLGLPITKKLIKLMDGVINIKSRYGEGTEFKVVIPQKVIEDTPIVAINKTDKRYKFLCCFNPDGVPDFITHSFLNTFTTAMKRLDATLYNSQNIDDIIFESRNGRYTHVLISEKDYSENKTYFDDLAKKCFVIVMQERNSKIILGSDVVRLYKPFYIKKFCEIINRPFNVKNKDTSPDAFIAPKAKVLIVDDNIVNLKVAVGQMGTYRMEIDTASNGIAAVEMVKHKKYDIIFMDHLMPGMDGIETHREIRQIEKDYAKKIPVIALTARSESDIGGLYIKEGFQGFMPKPIPSSALRNTLLKWLPAEYIKKKENDA